MRCSLAVAAGLAALISGCGQAEPDRYKTKFTERPSKAVPPANGKESGKEKATENAPTSQGKAPEKPAEPAKGK